MLHVLYSMTDFMDYIKKKKTCVGELWMALSNVLFRLDLLISH